MRAAVRAVNTALIGDSATAATASASARSTRAIMAAFSGRPRGSSPRARGGASANGAHSGQSGIVTSADKSALAPRARRNTAIAQARPTRA